MVATCTIWLVSRPAISAPPEWSKTSDIVCVATCDAVEDSGETWQYDKNATYKIRTAAFLATRLRVKLTDGTDIKVKLRDLDQKGLWNKGITTYSYPVYFTGFQKGRTYLLLLKKDSDGSYILTSPYDGAQSAIELSSTPSVDFNQPVMSWIVRSATPSVLAKDAEVRRSALEFLGGFGETLAENTANGHVDADADPARKAAAVALKTVTVPAIASLVDTGDNQTRDKALVTLAALQYPNIIPKLASLGDGKSAYASLAVFAIGSYRVNNAAPLLCQLLVGHSAEMRRASAYSLRYCIAPKSVPFLVKSLQDPDIQVRYNAVCALYAATNKMPPVAFNAYPEKEKEYIAFWKSTGRKPTQH